MSFIYGILYQIYFELINYEPAWFNLNRILFLGGINLFSVMFIFLSFFLFFFFTIILTTNRHIVKSVLYSHYWGLSPEMFNI